jgi:hypothetical protein
MKTIAFMFATIACLAGCATDDRSAIADQIGTRPREATITISCHGNGIYTIDAPADCDAIPDLIGTYCDEYGGGGTADVPGCGFYWHADRDIDDDEASP